MHTTSTLARFTTTTGANFGSQILFESNLTSALVGRKLAAVVAATRRFLRRDIEVVLVARDCAAEHCRTSTIRTSVRSPPLLLPFIFIRAIESKWWRSSPYLLIAAVSAMSMSVGGLH